MINRREFTSALACGVAASPYAPGPLPRVSIVTGTRVPESFAVGGCVFARAYTACPDHELSRRALVTGCFPHARSAQPRLAAVFTVAGAESEPAVFVSEPDGDTSSEASTHILLAVRHPRLPRGKAFEFPVSTVDIAPTMLALMGSELPEGLHGRDLSGLLLSGQGERPESIFAEGKLNEPGEWRMVVRGLDKMVVRENLDVLHLFNLGEDPAEERDLAQEIGYQLKVDELKALVRAWMKRTGDGMDPSGLKRR